VGLFPVPRDEVNAAVDAGDGFHMVAPICRMKTTIWISYFFLNEMEIGRKWGNYIVGLGVELDR
jgi:hypothetical protein